MGQVEDAVDIHDDEKDDDLPCLWCQEDDCRGGCLL